MPRKKTLWFRFYVEAIHDRKLRRQDPAVRWLWVVILAVARKSPMPGYLLISDEGEGFDPVTPEDLADEAALKLTDVRKGLRTFEKLGMIATDDNVDTWYVTKWNDRQFESDDTTARTAKHRSRERSNEPRRNVPSNAATSSQGTPSSRARASRASQALATEAEAETELPPNPTLTRGEPSAYGDKTTPREAGTNPRARGTNPRAVAQRRSRLDGARNWGRSLAIGGSSRTDALAAIDREYRDDAPDLADAAVQAYDSADLEAADA